MVIREMLRAKQNARKMYQGFNVNAWLAIIY